MALSFLGYSCGKITAEKPESVFDDIAAEAKPELIAVPVIFFVAFILDPRVSVRDIFGYSVI